MSSGCCECTIDTRKQPSNVEVFEFDFESGCSVHSDSRPNNTSISTRLTDESRVSSFGSAHLDLEIIDSVGPPEPEQQLLDQRRVLPVTTAPLVGLPYLELPSPVRFCLSTASLSNTFEDPLHLHSNSSFSPRSSALPESTPGFTSAPISQSPTTLTAALSNRTDEKCRAHSTPLPLLTLPADMHQEGSISQISALPPLPDTQAVVSLGRTRPCGRYDVTKPLAARGVNDPSCVRQQAQAAHYQVAAPITVPPENECIFEMEVGSPPDSAPYAYAYHNEVCELPKYESTPRTLPPLPDGNSASDDSDFVIFDRSKPQQDEQARRRQDHDGDAISSAEDSCDEQHWFPQCRQTRVPPSEEDNRFRFAVHTPKPEHHRFDSECIVSFASGCGAFPQHDVHDQHEMEIGETAATMAEGEQQLEPERPAPVAVGEAADRLKSALWSWSIFGQNRSQSAPSSLLNSNAVDAKPTAMRRHLDASSRIEQLERELRASREREVVARQRELAVREQLSRKFRECAHLSRECVLERERRRRLRQEHKVTLSTLREEHERELNAIHAAAREETERFMDDLDEEIAKQVSDEVTSLRCALNTRNNDFEALRVEMEERSVAWEKQRAMLLLQLSSSNVSYDGGNFGRESSMDLVMKDGDFDERLEFIEIPERPRPMIHSGFSSDTIRSTTSSMSTTLSSASLTSSEFASPPVSFGSKTTNSSRTSLTSLEDTEDEDGDDNDKLSASPSALSLRIRELLPQGVCVSCGDSDHEAGVGASNFASRVDRCQKSIDSSEKENVNGNSFNSAAGPER